MTTPTPQPSREYSLLALYSALDKLVLEHPGRADEVERYLPGTTGPGQLGWSKQIEAMVARLSRDPSTAALPDARSALNMLITPQQQGFGGTPEPLFTPGQQARFTYISAVLARLGLPDTTRSTTTLLNQALSLAAPGDPAPNARAGAQLRKNFSANFNSYDDYTGALDAADPKLVSDVLKRMGPPCKGGVGESGSGSCVVLHSLIKSRPGAVSIDDVKKAADPINWPNHNKFFCQMDPLKPSQGWSRVLEHISTDCDQYHLKTAIKYWKGKTDDGAFYVNYELDDNRTETGDNLLVEVDNGTIYVSETSDGVVQVKSTKHVQIRGFSVTATSMWACVNGWNEYGELMFFGQAQDAPWQDSPDGDGTPIPPTSGTGTKVPVPTLPPGVRQELVEQSVAMLTNCLKDATETTSEYASRWLAGELRADDFVRYYGAMSARWASEPWRVLARMMESAGITPSATPPPSHQGGGYP